MLLVLALVAVGFSLLGVVRLGAARRQALLAQWPAVAFAGAAIFLAFRGAPRSALMFAVLAAAAWVVWPMIREKRVVRAGAPQRPSPEEARALADLGLGSAASRADIRRAYRERMARAHPDRGGSHEEAARLTAARDLLLKRR